MDTYTPTSSGTIVHSKSNNTYFIDLNGHCSCKGYNYYAKCRHTEYVKSHKLLEILNHTDTPTKPINEDWINNMVHRLTHVREV